MVPCRILIGLLTVLSACVDQKKPPTAFDTDWSFCGFPPTVPEGVTKGWVALKVTISEEGKPVWVVPIASSDPAFAAHATDCVMRETFEPALNEQAVPVKEDVFVRVRFVR